MYFLRDLVGRRKKWLHVDDARTINVPQYKSLSVDEILLFCTAYPQVDAYLPDPPDLGKVPKQWLVNVCAAVIGEPFKRWVWDRVVDRNDEMNTKNEVMIAADPVIAERFYASNHVSSKCRPPTYCI